MSYRPEGFDKKAKDILKKYSSVIDEDGVDYESIIEDTADAMLEALRKGGANGYWSFGGGWVSLGGVKTPSELIPDGVHLTVIVIPDEG